MAPGDPPADCPDRRRAGVRLPDTAEALAAKATCRPGTSRKRCDATHPPLGESWGEDVPPPFYRRKIRLQHSSQSPLSLRERVRVRASPAWVLRNTNLLRAEPGGGHPAPLMDGGFWSPKRGLRRPSTACRKLWAGRCPTRWTASAFAPREGEQHPRRKKIRSIPPGGRGERILRVFAETEFSGDRGRVLHGAVGC